MCVRYIVFCTLFIALVYTQRLPTGLRVYTKDFTAARLNPQTGEISCEYSMKLPNVSAPQCSWQYGKGTRGQTTAIFFVNQSFFFLLQEICDGQPNRLALISSMGPFCSSSTSDPAVFYPVGYFNYARGIDINSFNLAWDHTCNIVVMSPSQPQEKDFVVNQVSFYDGQQRIQPSYSLQDGWTKKSGTGGLDFGTFSGSGPASKEWNCGDTCIFYTLEEKTSEKNSPAYFVGRAYRSASLKTNTTDSVQLQSLSWNPFAQFIGRQNQFLGIGKCCRESWCHSDCASIADGNLVLISYTPKIGFSVLSDIGESDDDTVRLGVEFSAPLGQNPENFAYVLHKNSVLTFALGMSDGIVGSAKLSNQSPQLNVDIQMWANSGFF